MKTIKHLLLLATACIATSVFAQKTSLGFTIGTSIANMKSKASDKTETSDSKTGFTTGVLINVPLNPHISIQPALNFVQKGGKSSDNSYKDELTLNYIELPVNVIYNSGKYDGFFIGGGPALSAGISGKWKSTDLRVNVTDEGKLKFGNDEMNDDFKTIEVSANLLAGYKFPAGVQVAINYNSGLSSLLNYSTDDKMKNRYYGISVGYVIHSKKHLN